MDHLRSIDDVVDTLRGTKKAGKRCTLLIGAGCSVDAEIPTAAGFVECIQKDYGAAYRRAKTKTYPDCMAELLPAQRRSLIAEYVDPAKINWTHVCIARLLQTGYVDRILTTNFDLLAAKACALLGEFPAIYDFAASQLFKPDYVPERALFYLHGQRTGFVLMNTADEMAAHFERLAPVFGNAGDGRAWIVVGYSGETDPVFNHLTGVGQFDFGLYWVGYGDGEPPRHVQEQLLATRKDAFFVPGFDANSFFVTLAQKLGIFPPALVARPFSYLRELLERLAPYQLPGQGAEADVTVTGRQWIEQAIERYERAPAAPADPLVAATNALMRGKYREVLRFRDQYDRSPQPDLAEALAGAYTALASQHAEAARRAIPRSAQRLYRLAAEKFEAALTVKPDLVDALQKWGNMLGDWANQKEGPEAESLYQQAAEKYERALKIGPDEDVLGNWGLTLLDQAKRASGPEAEALFARAGQKLEQAEALRPGAGAYDLACLSALTGDTSGCRKWLDKARDAGTLPAPEHIEADEDLESVRGADWFRSFLDELPS